jgi:hypothetical protein
MFAKHSWYFRNALVRANYRNIQKGLDYSPIYLVRFFRNLLLKDSWVLNKFMKLLPLSGLAKNKWAVDGF